MTRALLILGPTASGKTALALSLAERLNGEIINADSMQVYQDLRVLTARPTPEEEALCPHHLFGTVDAAARFSVGEWLRAATPILAAIWARGRTPLIVGGTGLYFKALTGGLAAIPDPPAEGVDALRAELSAAGPEALHARLAAVDPAAAAALEPRDGVRIVRALAVMEATGRSILDWRTEAAKPAALGPEDWSGFALTPDRSLLYARIEARFSAMLAAGALDEARALAARRLDPTLPAMKAHGAPWLMAHLEGRMSLEEAAALSVRDTRRYAKRQFTWISHQAVGFARIAEVGLEGQKSSVIRVFGG
jgi:tRNA dimethylallyltransferase